MRLLGNVTNLFRALCFYIVEHEIFGRRACNVSLVLANVLMFNFHRNIRATKLRISFLPKTLSIPL